MLFRSLVSWTSTYKMVTVRCLRGRMTAGPELVLTASAVEHDDADDTDELADNDADEYLIPINCWYQFELIMYIIRWKNVQLINFTSYTRCVNLCPGELL